MRPLLGWGQGVLKMGTVTRFYNVELDWFITAGLLGLGAFLWVITEAFIAISRIENAKEKAALAAFLVAYLVNGVFIYDTLVTNIPLYAVLIYLASEPRNVARRTSGVDDHEPLLNRGV